MRAVEDLRRQRRGGQALRVRGVQEHAARGVEQLRQRAADGGHQFGMREVAEIAHVATGGGQDLASVIIGIGNGAGEAQRQAREPCRRDRQMQPLLGDDAPVADHLGPRERPHEARPV